MTLLFCDVGEDGKITESIQGERIIPGKQYHHFYYLTENSVTVTENIPYYKIVNGQLTLEI